MVDQGRSRLNYEEDPVNIALWILPCLAFACAGAPDRPVEAATSPTPARRAIPCDDASMHPEFYTETERIRCEYQDEIDVRH